MKYQSDLYHARAHKKQIQAGLKRLKKRNSREVDTLFHEQHDQVFQEIDCLSCANCCKTTSPIFRDIDIKRISKHLRMKETEFIDSYLEMDIDEDWVLKKAPCHFLNEQDNTCNIYGVRPLACREYPHTDRKKMTQILSLTERNTRVCPAVSRMVRNLLENDV